MSPEYLAEQIRIGALDYNKVVNTFPELPQTKHVYICLSGDTLKLGEWSSWNGHKPKKFLPLGSRLIYDDIISTILALLRMLLISSFGITVIKTPSNIYLLPLSTWFPLNF